MRVPRNAPELDGPIVTRFLRLLLQAQAGMPKKAEDDEESVSDVVSEPAPEEENEEESNDLTKADIVTKYRCAGDIANSVLQQLLAAVKPGATCVELCSLGDRLVDEAVSKIYNKKAEGGKKIEKGSAFPTCISVNHCVGHYSPLLSEDKVVLEEGDVVKIDLGVHVDGYIATLAHTVLCGSPAAAGRKADVIQAAYQAAELAQRMYKEGCANSEITEMISKVAADFKCNPVEGVLSHQMKKHVIDANKVIINKPSTEQQVAKAEIEKNDVFAMDIVMSTGEGKPRPSELRTTVFKRNISEKYSLKMKASRSFFSEVSHILAEGVVLPLLSFCRAFLYLQVNQRFPTMPFTLRAGDERNWRMGVVECVKHSLFTEYPVLFDKEGTFVAQFKFTVMLLPSGNAVRITGGPPPDATSEFALQDPALQELLAVSTEKKKKNKPKKKKAGDKEDN
ncbi:MAG: hypothetical protein SGPRY_006058 [Prymnesium sp.]